MSDDPLILRIRMAHEITRDSVTFKGDAGRTTDAARQFEDQLRRIVDKEIAAATAPLRAELDRVRAERDRMFDWRIGVLLSRGLDRAKAEKAALRQMTDPRHGFDGTIMAVLAEHDRKAAEAVPNPGPGNEATPMKLDIDREWPVAMAEKEGGGIISAGGWPSRVVAAEHLDTLRGMIASPGHFRMREADWAAIKWAVGRIEAAATELGAAVRAIERLEATVVEERAKVAAMREGMAKLLEDMTT